MTDAPEQPQTQQAAHADTAQDNAAAIPGMAIRSAIGGALMGLANLVPGISGGTMLLAAGVYTAFIDAIADITRLKWNLRAFVTLGAVVGAALFAIIALAGPVKGLVIDHRWVMYSLFIGLTLGGLPIVWKMAKPATPSTWGAAAFGFLGMAALALAQAQGSSGDADRSGLLFMFLAGVAGASAMVLPGVSGGYLLLVLGVYVPLLSAIDRCKDAVSARDISALIAEWDVVIPVGLGVVVGVVVVAQALRILLAKFEKPTLGVLIGLLLGAVVGLWPFQAPVTPEPGDTLKGQTVVVVEDRVLDEEDPDGAPVLVAVTDLGEYIEAEDWPTAYFEPTPIQIGGALALIAVGFGLTTLIGLMDKSKPKRAS